LKTYQIFFPFTLRRRNLKNTKITGLFEFVFGKTRAGELNDPRGVIVFKKLSFENVFRSHENENPSFLNSSDLKSIFEKLRLT